MEFTGEFFIPGKTEKRIEKDHYARYMFSKKYVRNKRILDIACGVGYGAEVMGSEYSSYLGVDINPQNIQYAKNTYRKNNVEYVEGNVLSFKDDPFDIILCFETIEHVKDYKKALTSLYGNLKPGGLLIISSPNRIITSKHALNIEDRPENKFHTQEFLPMELISELSLCGFHTENIGFYGQRQAYKFNISILQKAYNYIFKPKIRSSPRVKPVNHKAPRYFILVAKK